MGSLAGIRTHALRGMQFTSAMLYHWAIDASIELVSKELNHLAAILHVYAGGLNFMK